MSSFGLTHVNLLAQFDASSGLSRSMSDPSTSSSFALALVGCAAVGLVTICVFIWLVRRQIAKRQQSMEYQRWRLFQELCLVHELNRNDFLNLKRLAKALKLENPAMLFVRPDCFEVSRPIRHFTPEAWDSILVIRDQLFSRRLSRKALEPKKPVVENEDKLVRK